MASSYSQDGPRRPRSGRLAEEAALLAPPEEPPTQITRSMFARTAPEPEPAPLTNMHLQRVARMGGPGGGAKGGDLRPRSAAASSVRGGRAAFSVISDEEVIDVDGEPTTLGDEDLGLYGGPAGGAYGGRGYGGGGGGGRAGGQRAAAHPAGHDQDPLEALEADTPLARLQEVQRELAAEMESGNDPWVMVHLAQVALGHAKVVVRTMPVAVREEPLLLPRAHQALARAYQRHGCDKQAADHGKQALNAIPPDVADTEEASLLRCEVLVMRAESLLSTASAPGTHHDAAAATARKALGLLVKAAGLQEPVAWTAEEAEDADAPGREGTVSTIDPVTDMGVVALMAQCHGLVAESRLKATEGVRAMRQASLRAADEAAVRCERRTDRGDLLYTPEQQERLRMQERHYRDEADAHEAEVHRLASEAERAYDAAYYCLNHVIDVEGSRLESELGREGKLGHPTFRALWQRSLDFMAGTAEAYGLQGKLTDQLRCVEEVLSAFAQYGEWLPAARHVKALKDKGALLVAKGDHEGALATYNELSGLVDQLFEDDVVRREVQGAEVLKLRGDVALAAGDFRSAQHLFSQALELFQRHLGVTAGVAQDLEHRIDEVKAYLADTRVLGRLASLPPPGARSSTAASSHVGGPMSPGSTAGGGGGGGGLGLTAPSVATTGGASGSAASTPKAASVARSSMARSPLTVPGGGGSNPTSARPSSALSNLDGSGFGMAAASFGGTGGAAGGYGGGGGSGGGDRSGLNSSLGGPAAGGSVSGSDSHSLAPGHRLPHLNTLQPNGMAKSRLSDYGTPSPMSMQG